VELPKEQEDDVIQTEESIDDFKDIRSLIVPLFFVPLGKLKNKDWFHDTQLSEFHKQLLIKFAEARFFWVDSMLNW
jgi:hypothetical protein